MGRFPITRIKNGMARATEHRKVSVVSLLFVGVCLTSQKKKTKKSKKMMMRCHKKGHLCVM